MEQQISLYRVFIASPSDLGEERQILRDVVTEINGIFARETDWRIELLGWEDTMPGAGRPQDLINADVDKANLLIGCLWTRWGTETGSGKTGFQEEFERALARRNETGEPEICLFFKDISDEQRKDPGEQLKKVLEFQTAEEKAKRLLYQRFNDGEDWRRKITPLLNCQLLRRVTNKALESGQVVTKTQPTTAAPPTAAPSTQPSSRPAVASIASLLRTCGEQLSRQSLFEFRDSAQFDDARCSRLQIFASSMYNWKIQPVEVGAHECNSIYWHRRKVNLTSLERLFLIRSVLLDFSLTKPGWFWTSRWRVPMTVWLPWIIRFDRADGARTRSLDFANDINFPLTGGSTGAAVYSALEDQNIGVRLAALRYLQAHGRPAAIHHLRKLKDDPERGVRDEAASAIFSIRLRANADREFRRILKEGAPLTESLISALRVAAREVPATTLLRFVEHTSPQFRLIAVSELQRRKELPLPIRLQLTQDDSRLVREKAFYSLIDHNASPAPAEIRSQLAEHPTSLFSGFGERPDSDSVVAYYLAKRNQEELWRHVALLDRDSAIAMRMIGQRFFPQSADVIRDNLVDDFERIVAAAKLRREQQSFGFSSYTTLWGGDPIENERQRVRTEALAVLARHATAADAEFFKRFLSSEVSAADQTIACLRGLAMIGDADNLRHLKPLLSNAPSPVRAAAARAYLALSGDASASIRELLKTPVPIVVFVVVAWDLAHRNVPVWADVKPLLSSDDEDVRRLASYYATSVLTRRDLRALLNEYLRSGWYYYNVVALLDRALYAPPNVRRYLRRQEVTHFSKLSSDANRGWSGLLL
jgi:HEAT repeat protein